MPSVLVCDPIHEAGVDILKSTGYDVEVRSDIGHDDLVSSVDRFDALVVRGRTQVDREVIDAGDRLSVIARAGVGLDNIDVEYAKEREIDVVNAPEALTQSVAELAIGLLLCLARGIVRGDSSMKDDEWLKKKLMGVELSGRTLGIVGFGRIGRRTCEIALEMGMNVIAYEILEIGREYLDRGVGQVPLEEVLVNSDFITLHVPLTDDTYHMIDGEALDMMKKEACLVNVSRGKVVDSEALEQALRSGDIRGAALDVFEEEPPRRRSLVEMDNVIATPHIGAQTVDAQRKAAVVVCKKAVDILGQ